ncbi:MAG: hypothetical protein JJE39_15775, partial [Vicinamibacteria bacterium]|nr:hypothetical protein [Vicinamibacteria bacterium]
MNKILAVALLDIRRLGFGVLSAALIAGLIPAFVSGMGSSVPIAKLMSVAFLLVGLVAGGYFGGDFAEGRASFFFARPLPTAVLIAGRFVALLALASTTFLAIMASNWLSTSDRTGWTFWILQRSHLESLGASWAWALLASLSVAAHGKGERGVRNWRDLAVIPFRLGLVLGGVILVFGLFADLSLRAYSNSPPIRLFFGTWTLGLFVASCVGIVAGRTERMRIARFQNLVMYAQLALTAFFVLGAWAYVLHPGPDAIRSVIYAKGSPDGRFAYVETQVDRGEPRSFRPI